MAFTTNWSKLDNTRTVDLTNGLSKRPAKCVKSVFGLAQRLSPLRRAVAEEVVHDLNKIIGRSLAWEIDLQKWEDLAPGFGRPQSLINACRR